MKISDFRKQNDKTCNTCLICIIYIYMLNLPTVHMIPRVTQDSRIAETKLLGCQAQPLENLQEEVEVGDRTSTAIPGFGDGCMDGWIWMFPKIGVPPNHPLKNRFSIIFTIHFGGFPPIFGNTYMVICGPWFMFKKLVLVGCWLVPYIFGRSSWGKGPYHQGHRLTPRWTTSQLTSR